MAPLPTQIGPYRVIRKLGEGGMGEVYEALHQTIERQVAIKVLRPQYARDPDIQQRFINEARAVNLINHPGLVQISDFEQLADGSRYIVMEYLHGETLGQRIKRLPGRLPLFQVLHTTWQVAAALVAAHAVGITHRDLKPDNIMLVADLVTPTGERAKLLDFGIARLDADRLSNKALTGSCILGTPTYMSPEQCRGVGQVGPPSDVYSLGVMLYQLLAGRPPFVAAGIGELISMHLSHEPPPLHELSPETSAELVALVHSLLKKDQAERPTMRQVVARLEQLQALQGAAGAPLATQSIAPAVESTEYARLSNSLAALLGGEIETEASIRDVSAGEPAVLAFAPTHAAPPHRPPPPPPPEAPPTLISGGHSMMGIGERLQPPGEASPRWSFALVVVASGGLLALATWLMLPSRATVPRAATRAAEARTKVQPPPALATALPAGTLPLDTRPVQTLLGPADKRPAQVRTRPEPLKESRPLRQRDGVATAKKLPRDDRPSISPRVLTTELPQSPPSSNPPANAEQNPPSSSNLPQVKVPDGTPPKKRFEVID